MASSLPHLLIEKCAQAIDGVIMPALTDESALAQARYTAAILHKIAPFIEERSVELIQENRSMREVLARVRRTLSRKPLPSNAVWTGLLESLRQGLRSRPCPDLPEDNYRLKGLLAQTIRDLDLLSADLSTKALRSLEQDIQAVLRQQLDHSLAISEGFRFG